MASLADKLRRRWTDTGSGPDVQKKLDAIEGTMKAREALKRLEKQQVSEIEINPEHDLNEKQRYLAKVKKAAKLEEKDLNMKKVLPKEALDVAREERREESEIVSKEDLEAEKASEQLVDVFEKRKRTTPDARLKEVNSEHSANVLREKANGLMRANDLKMAVAMYDEALNLCKADLRRKRKEEEEEEEGREEMSYNNTTKNKELSEEELIAVVTLCNRSKAKLKDGEDVFGALEDAIQATTIAPEWSKARFRCGEAYAARSAWSLAVTSLRVGEKLVELEKGTSSQPF